MNNTTKLIIGIGAVSIIGYLVWKQTKKKSFANFSSKSYAVKCGDGTLFFNVRVPIITGVTTTKLDDAQMILQTFNSCDTKGKISSIT